jgi:hypothetical protein
MTLTHVRRQVVQRHSRRHGGRHSRRPDVQRPRNCLRLRQRSMLLNFFLFAPHEEAK